MTELTSIRCLSIVQTNPDHNVTFPAGSSSSCEFQDVLTGSKKGISLIQRKKHRDIYIKCNENRGNNMGNQLKMRIVSKYDFF